MTLRKPFAVVCTGLEPKVSGQASDGRQTVETGQRGAGGIKVSCFQKAIAAVGEFGVSLRVAKRHGLRSPRPHGTGLEGAAVGEGDVHLMGQSPGRIVAFSAFGCGGHVDVAEKRTYLRATHRVAGEVRQGKAAIEKGNGDAILQREACLHLVARV